MRKLSKDRLYKDKYLIALYDHDDMCIGVYDNPWDMANCLGRKTEHIYTMLGHKQDKIIVNHHIATIHLIEAN